MPRTFTTIRRGNPHQASSGAGGHASPPRVRPGCGTPRPCTAHGPRGHRRGAASSTSWSRMRRNCASTASSRSSGSQRRPVPSGVGWLDVPGGLVCPSGWVVGLALGIAGRPGRPTNRASPPTPHRQSHHHRAGPQPVELPLPTRRHRRRHRRPSNRLEHSASSACSTAA